VPSGEIPGACSWLSLHWKPRPGPPEWGRFLIGGDESPLSLDWLLDISRLVATVDIPALGLSPCGLEAVHRDKVTSIMGLVNFGLVGI